MAITESPETLSKRLDENREETKRFMFHFNQLQANYPEFFNELHQRHPGINKLINQINGLGMLAASDLKSDEIVKVLITYNFYGEQINHVLEQLNREVIEAQERSFVDSMNQNVDKLPVELTPEEEAEIKVFTKDLWDEMFPESNVDRFMGWVTGQKISEQGKLRWFFAPANGIEMAIMGFIDLFKLETYTDLIETVQYMYGMSYEDWCDAIQMLKLAYENLSTEDTVNASIAIICGIAFFGGGLKKMATKFDKLKCAPKLKKIVQSVSAAHATEQKLKPLPASVLGGMTLKYG